jgi:hypothetical protein
MDLSASDAIQRMMAQLAAGEVPCADAMAALCRDRAPAREFAAIPAPLADVLVRGAVEAATRALSAGDASKGANMLTALRHLLACPRLRDVAIKAPHPKSLAISAFESMVRGCDVTDADSALAAVLPVLQEAGVDITKAGSLEDDTTPLLCTAAQSLLESSQMLLDAGADVNGLSANGAALPLSGAALARSDDGMAWLRGLRGVGHPDQFSRPHHRPRASFFCKHTLRRQPRGI